jgi:UDP-glucose 4-epimerase
MRDSLATSIFLNAALSGNAIHIHGTGEQTRCFTHVRDICSAIRLVLEDRSVFGIINIADNNEVSISELAEISMKVVGRRVPVIFVNDRDGQIIRSSIDNSLLCALGWSPQWSLEDGLAEIVSHTMEIVQP